MENCLQKNLSTLDGATFGGLSPSAAGPSKNKLILESLIQKQRSLKSHFGSEKKRN